MRVLAIVRVIAVICAGLLAGIFLGYLASTPARAVTQRIELRSVSAGCACVLR